MIKYDFKNKNVIVTGSAMGLGYEIAKQYQLAGANVILTDINDEQGIKAKETLSKLGNCNYYHLDVSNYEEVENTLNKIIKNYKIIDILINNAGICECINLKDENIKFIDKMLKVNINGTIYTSKIILEHMKENKYGKIVNMSSIAAKLSGAGACVYSATKAAILSFTASTAREYAPYNINVNCICPGIIRTPLWEKMLNTFTNNEESKKDEVFKSFTDTIPTNRPQDPIDIANACLFLTADESYNITGQNLGVDGGQTY